MRICIIAEGCYPYVVGGVSGWIQMMITGLKEHEFQIYTISADPSQSGKFKYELPSNLIQINENFLLGNESLISKRQMKRLPKNQVDPLKKMIKSDLDTPWKEIFQIIHTKDFDTKAYLGSYDFFDAAKERYERDNVSTGFSDYLWTLRSMFMPLFSLLEKDIPKADIYHASAAGYAGIVGGLGSLLYNKPFILSEHGIYTREREEELIRSKWTKGYFKEMWIRHFYSLSLFAYMQANAVISLFEKNADIQKDLGCPPEKITIIPNGLSPEDFETPKQQEKKKDSWVDVGAVIRVTPIKDIKTMISSFKEVQNQTPNTRFHILGPYDEDPEYYQECVALIQQLDLHNCEMPGRVNVKEYLPYMDIMVLTSISEGQPLAILEGMMYKKPWVTTNVGSCSELMNGMSGDNLGAAGFVSPIMDVYSISKNIIKLVQNERLRADMGEIGYQRVIKYYRKDDMFASYRALYDESYDKSDSSKRGDEGDSFWPVSDLN